MRAYLNAGLGVLLTTWRGYSGNPGTPTEDGLYADGRAARAFLRARGCGDARQILYGESLGTGVAVHLARESTPAALVLEAPFSSVVDIASGRFPLLPVRLLIVDRFDSAAKIGKVAAPVLIVHGERDRTIPVRLARRLFKRAREPKEAVFIPEADHADLPDSACPPTSSISWPATALYRPLRQENRIDPNLGSRYLSFSESYRACNFEAVYRGGGCSRRGSRASDGMVPSGQGGGLGQSR